MLEQLIGLILSWAEGKQTDIHIKDNDSIVFVEIGGRYKEIRIRSIDQDEYEKTSALIAASGVHAALAD